MAKSPVSPMRDDNGEECVGPHLMCRLSFYLIMHRLDEAEREMRSCFVSQLSNKVDDRILANFFENVAKVGAVREAKVIVDRISRRSKGCVAVLSLSKLARANEGTALATSSSRKPGLLARLSLSLAPSCSGSLSRFSTPKPRRTDLRWRATRPPMVPLTSPCASRLCPHGWSAC